MHNSIELLQGTSLDTEENHQKLRKQEKYHSHTHLHVILKFFKLAHYFSNVKAQEYFDQVLQCHDAHSLRFLFEALHRLALDADSLHLLQERYIELIQLPHSDIKNLGYIIGLELPHTPKSLCLVELFTQLNLPLDSQTIKDVLIHVLDVLKQKKNSQFSYYSLLERMTVHVKHKDQEYMRSLFSMLYQNNHLFKILDHDSPEKAYYCIQELHAAALSSEAHIDALLSFEKPLQLLHAYIILEKENMRTEENWQLVSAHREGVNPSQTRFHLISYNKFDDVNNSTAKYIAELLVPLHAAQLFEPQQFEQMIHQFSNDIKPIADCIKVIQKRGLFNQATFDQILSHEDKKTLYKALVNMKDLDLDQEQLQQCMTHSDIKNLANTLWLINNVMDCFTSIKSPKNLYDTAQKRVLTHPKLKEIVNALSLFYKKEDGGTSLCSKVGDFSYAKSVDPNMYAFFRSKKAFLPHFLLPLLISKDPYAYMGWLYTEMKKIDAPEGPTALVAIDHLNIPDFILGCLFTEYDVSIRVDTYHIPMLSRLLLNDIYQKKYHPEEFPLKRILTPEAFDMLLGELETQHTAEAHFLAGLLLHGKIPSQVRITMNQENDPETMLYSDDPETSNFLTCRAYAEHQGLLLRAIQHYEQSIVLLAGQANGLAVRQTRDLIDYFVWEIQTTTDDLSVITYLEKYKISTPTTHTPESSDAAKAIAVEKYKFTPPTSYAPGTYAFFWSSEEPHPQRKPFSEFVMENIAEEAPALSL